MHWVAFALVLARAAFARLFALDTLPPGLKYDAASNGVTILAMLCDGARPFFVNAMGAPEPLILYLQAIVVWLFGPTTFSLRVITALASVLSVASLYGCAYEFTRDRRVALVAAFALATSLELFNLARYGIRFIFVTLFATAVLYFFARAWRTGSWRTFVLGGITLGLSVYTYPAALLIPVGLALVWAHHFIFDRARWWTRLKPTLAMWSVAMVVALPRIVFQILYPSVAFARVNQVSAWQRTNIVETILARLVAYAKMFGIEWHDGTFGIPLLDPGLFVLFVIGVIVCLARWRRIEWFWAVIMLGIMFLPDLLAADEPTLNKVRLIGIFPFAFFFVGAGASALLEKIPLRAQRIASIVVAIVLLASAVNSFNAYFVERIADTPRNSEFDDFNVSRGEVAEATWINQQSDPVYLPLNEFARSPVRYLTGTRAPRLQSALDENGKLVAQAMPAHAWVMLPESLERGRSEGRLYVHDPAAYVLITNGVAYLLPPTSEVESQLQARQPSQKISDMNNSVAAFAYTIDATNSPFRFANPGARESVRFASHLFLMSSVIGNSRVQPGEKISLALYWSVLQKTTIDYTIFAHLLDTNENVISSVDIFPALGAYPTYQWKTNEIVPTHFVVRVPARTAPGKYLIEVGLYDLAQNRLDVLDANGRTSDNRVIVGAVKIAPRVTNTFTPKQTQRANFDGRIAFTGFDLPRTGKIGAPIEVALYWQALTEMERDYTMFVHLLDANRNIVAQADHQPQAGAYPTSIWDVNESVRDAFTLELPRELQPGKYTLRVGWYDLQTGARLPLRDASGDAITLDAMVEVTR